MSNEGAAAADRVHTLVDQVSRLTQSDRDRFARIISTWDLPGQTPVSVSAPFGRMAGEYDAAVEKTGRGLEFGVAEPLTLDNVNAAFQYQPWNHHQQQQGDQVRELLTFAAKGILRNVPSGPLRTRALNHLIDARMIANAAITFGGRF